MIRTEIKRNICSVWFVVAIALMYALFMTGDSGKVLNDWTSTTVIAAIWEKLHGNWQQDLGETSSLIKMYDVWTDSRYLPVFAPIFCSLPAMLRCRDEAESGSKRYVLARGSQMRYYAAKFIGGIISAALVMLIATAAYDVTILISYDWFPPESEEFQDAYYYFTGVATESAEDVSWPLLALNVARDRIYFCLYAAMGSALCFFFASAFRSRYTVFGSAILLCYVQDRVVDELATRSIDTGKGWMLTASYVLEPEFLRQAGRFGFYGDKEPLVLIVAAAWILLFYGLAFYVMSRCTDVGER
ncbi:MAG: hypothetical protein LUI02_06910 [Clostridiales bacterium]|nr:hypothetical protein [Clostridiales bacterium]